MYTQMDSSEGNKIRLEWIKVKRHILKTEMLIESIRTYFDYIEVQSYILSVRGFLLGWIWLIVGQEGLVWVFKMYNQA